MCLHLASGILKLQIRKSDRHLTAFRGAEGTSWAYVRWGFSFRTVPSAPAKYGGQANASKCEAVTDVIIIPTKTVEDQFGLLLETFDRLRDRRQSVNLPKSEFVKAVVKWLGMVLDSFGERVAPRKNGAVTQLFQPTTVERRSCFDGNERVSPPIHTQLRQVVGAPLSDLLRDSRLGGKRARSLSISWGTVHRESMKALVELLTKQPILALLNWQQPFRFHTNASDIGAGGIFT